MLAPLPVRSTGRTVVSTPWALVRRYEAMLGERFRLDVCASKENAKAPLWIDETMDAFETEWNFGSPCWMNPPFGRGIGHWLVRARQQSLKYGLTVVALLPVRTGTRWWAEHVDPVLSGKRLGWLHWISGRVAFEGEKAPPPFDCCVLGILPFPDIPVTRRVGLL